MCAKALVVTAADDRYRRCLAQLLASLRRVDPNGALDVVVVDLGLAPRARDRLGRTFPNVLWHTFDFNRVAEFARIRPRSVNTNGWKPVVVGDALRRARSSGASAVLWVDSACVFLDAPTPALRWIREHGVYAPFGGASSISERTHPAALAAERLNDESSRARMRASGVLGFDPASTLATWVVDEWTRASADPALLCPEGATLANHRFDQSTLNFVLERRGPQGRGADHASSDALDISSSRPIAWLRSRNKVRSAIPESMDAWVRSYFWGRRHIDVTLWKMREALGQSRAREPAP